MSDKVVSRRGRAVVVQWTLKKCAKKCDASSKLLVYRRHGCLASHERVAMESLNYTLDIHEKPSILWFQFLYLEVSCLKSLIESQFVFLTLYLNC